MKYKCLSLLQYSLFRLPFFFSVILFISSCDSCQTRPDVYDKTPPTVQWIITPATGEKDTIDGNGTYAISFEEGIQVMAVVKDEGGIDEVHTSQLYNWDCFSDGLGLQSPFFGPVTQSMPLGLDSHGNALTLFPVGFDVTTYLVCPTGLNFQQGAVTLKCAGTNFGHLTTEGSLKIHINKKL